MKKIFSYSEFLKESKLQNDIEDYFEITKKLKNIKITIPLQFQKIDREYYFEFIKDKIEYRLHYSIKNNNIILTNMDTGEEELITSIEDFLNKIN